ncbi:MAG TPA: ABC transporter permease [Streptosporangiaceae bacterium]|nr:ABC transporter permease [Streptosporangiaceae bacterium]
MSVTAVPVGLRPAIVRLALTELRLFARERARFVARLALPIVLLVIFGSIPFYTQARRSLHGHSLFEAYVPILIAYSLAIISLTALPMVLADYRDKGVLRRLQTTPAGASRVIGAQLLAYLAVVAVTVVLILAVARIGYGVFLPREVAGFIVAALLAAGALICVGLLIAAVSPSAQAAQAIGTILFFPLMFFAGLFFPIPVMPSFLRHLSHATPLGAAVQALQDAWLGHWPHPLQLLTLAAYLVVCGIAAARLFRWK